VQCVQAVLNPLQAFLNSIVYRGVGLCYRRVILRDIQTDGDNINDNTFSRLAEGGSSAFAGMSADESSPLLRSFEKFPHVS